VIITVDDLEHASACQEYIGKFIEAASGNETADIEFNKAAQGLLLGDPVWRQVFGWAVRVGLIPMWSMYGANLSHADLSHADLRGADLYSADLYGANLYGANLHDADLRSANLPEGYDAN